VPVSVEESLSKMGNSMFRSWNRICFDFYFTLFNNMSCSEAECHEIRMVSMATDHTRKDFLDAIFNPYYEQNAGFIIVRTSERSEAKTGTRYFPNSDSLSREQYSSETNVYFGVCPREKMKPGKEHVRYITCLWAGIDIGPDGYSGREKHFRSEEQALMVAMAFPLKPSIIVQSGRGMHLYWLLKRATEIKDPDRIEQLLSKIGNYFQCPFPSGPDAALRLPETWNSKDPFRNAKCVLARMDPNLRYDLEEFQDLDLRIVIPSRRVPRMPQVNLPSPVRISFVDPNSSGSQAPLRKEQPPEEQL
jgi:hypothetical protein